MVSTLNTLNHFESIGPPLVAEIELQGASIARVSIELQARIGCQHRMVWGRGTGWCCGCLQKGQVLVKWKEIDSGNGAEKHRDMVGFIHWIRKLILRHHHLQQWESQWEQNRSVACTLTLDVHSLIHQRGHQIWMWPPSCLRLQGHRHVSWCAPRVRGFRAPVADSFQIRESWILSSCPQNFSMFCAGDTSPAPRFTLPKVVFVEASWELKGGMGWAKLPIWLPFLARWAYGYLRIYIYIYTHTKWYIYIL